MTLKYNLIFASMIASGLLSEMTTAAQVSDFASGTPPAYQTCKTDVDCIAVEHRCLGWNILNQEGKKEFYRIGAQIDVGIVCSQKDRKPRPMVACRNYQCTYAY